MMSCIYVVGGADEASADAIVRMFDEEIKNAEYEAEIRVEKWSGRRRDDVAYHYTVQLDSGLTDEQGVINYDFFISDGDGLDEDTIRDQVYHAVLDAVYQYE